jgi:glycosyltransferase involved in cell wall biosynthesis
VGGDALRAMSVAPSPDAPLQGRDLVVFSNDWEGDPLSKTHIMRILARDNRVLWVNSIGNRTPRPTAHDIARLWRKASAALGGLREVERNIFVLAPLALPIYGPPWAATANKLLLRGRVRRAMAHLGFRRPISWSFLPASAPVSGTLGEELVVYQCVDEFSAFGDTNAQAIARLETELLRKADLVITSAERLRANKAKVNPSTVLVRHGVDVAHFAKACDPRTEIPEDLRRLPKPVFGFYGLVADWVDLEAFAACARAFPNGSVVLIGKVAPKVGVSMLEALPNVHFLGRRRYDDLPAYCRGFDVALLPFRNNELTLNANPLKVREYLAAGLPVVASDLPEVRTLGLCRLVSSASGFPMAVRAALDEGAGPRLERAARLTDESWEARVDEIRLHVEEALARTRA